MAKSSYEYCVNAATDSTHVWHNRLKNIATYDAQLIDGGGEEAQLRACGIFCRVWKGIKRAAVDVYTFVKSGWRETENEDGDTIYTWNLEVATNKSGEASSGVE